MKTLIVSFSLRVEGDSEPMITGYRRIPWPDDQMPDDVLESVMKKGCRELHAPKRVLVTV